MVNVPLATADPKLSDISLEKPSYSSHKIDEVFPVFSRMAFAVAVNAPSS
jgi:hypothetical protein